MEVSELVSQAIEERQQVIKVAMTTRTSKMQAVEEEYERVIRETDTTCQEKIAEVVKGGEYA